MRQRTLEKLLFWFVLAIPAAVMLVDYWQSPDAWPGDLLKPSGEWSARYLVAALALTPLAQLFGGHGAIRWLVRHRRAIGVSACLYALLHLIFYVLDMETVQAMLAELGAPGIWTGWLALACLLPPALTSRDSAMRRLGAAWKRLQRFAYPAAVLCLAHWALVHDGLLAAIAHFAPLALLELVRLYRSIPSTRWRIFA